MSTKHTPGPWVARQEFKNRWRIEAMPNGPDFVPLSVGLACTTVLEAGVDDSSTEANARLIAAAPDLLSALRDLVKAEEEYGDPNNAAVNESWLRARTLLINLTGEA